MIEPSLAEVDLVRADGVPFPARVRLLPVLEADGTPNGAIEVVEDVTTERRALAEKKRVAGRLEQYQRLESLGVLAGGIAHDFNNLLMSIQSNAELALRRTSPESPTRSCLQRIDAAAQRGAKLTNQMLAYAGKGPMVTEPIDLSALVQASAPLLATATSSEVTLRYRLGSDLPAIDADVSQVREVLLNLVLNGSEAIEGLGTVTIATEFVWATPAYLLEWYPEQALSRGPYVVLEVSDTGRGMDEVTRARIFDPLFTTRFLGRGLGLAAMLGIVHAHRAGLRVESEPGKGSVFRVLFPAGASEGAAAASVDELARRPA